MYNFKSTTSYIKPVVMKYKWQFYSIFFFTATRTVLSNVISPILYKRIIDVISNAGGDRLSVSHSLFRSIFFITILLPIVWCFGRLVQYLIAKFQSSVMRDLYDFSFKKLHGHSYTFFADHFSGALVNKSRKFVRAFEQMHDILVDNYWTSFVLLTSIFVVFFIQARLIAFIFFTMSIFYIFIVFLCHAKR